MSIARYASYRDSGIDWLGDVPSHWSTLGLRRAVQLRTEKATDRRWPIGLENIESGTGRFVETDSEFEGEGVAFSASDVLYGKLRPYLAKVLVAPQQGEAIGDFHVLSPDRRRLSPNFLAYLLLCPSVVSLLNGSTYGAKMPRVGWEFMGGLGVALPPLDEQAAIAAFLDRETGKIDALVEAQQRLIGLLKEKRQAVISHAVTKGIDAAAPMMDSGVKWMGKIPAHWSISQSRRLFAVRSEPALPDDQMLTASQKYGVLFQSDFVELEGRRVVEVIMGKDNLRHVEPDDFVISMRSFQGGLEWSRLRGSTSFHYVMVTPIKWVHPPFFAYLFKCLPYIQALRATTDLIRDGQEIRYSHFVKVPLPVIPLEEQREIADVLNVEISRYDNLLDQAARFILLLQELRAALVTAAVTGKIDVRRAATTVSGTDQAVARRLVGAVVLELVADAPASGRMTSAKRMYLAEAHARVWELQGQPQRMAAGPFDGVLMSEVEAELARVGHIATSQPGGPNSQVHYRLTGQRGALRADLDALLGDRRAVFDKMLADLAELKSKGVEAVATLYAVWNDMLIDGQLADDEAVIDGVLNDWHAEKRDKFTRPDLHNYLGWMRRHGMMPTGRGPRTKSGALL